MDGHLTLQGFLLELETDVDNIKNISRIECFMLRKCDNSWPNVLMSQLNSTTKRKPQYPFILDATTYLDLFLPGRLRYQISLSSTGFYTLHVC